MAKRIKKVGVAESVAQQLSMLVRCLGRHANYLRAHLLPGIPGEFVARDQLRCRSEQPVPCLEMKLRDDARGLHAQGEAHELPHGKRLLGMRRLTPVGIPFLQASHFYRPRIWSTGRTFWYVLAPAEGLPGQKPVANPFFARVSRINWPPLKV